MSTAGIKTPKTHSGSRTAGMAAFWVVLLLASLSPLMLPVQLRSATEIMLFVTMALSWNIVGGFTGYASFGHAAFLGLGAYTTAMLLKGGVPFVAAVALSLITGILLGILLGYPVMRLKGHYFSIATLGVQQALAAAIPNINWLGGAFGLNLAVNFSNQQWYIAAWVVAVITLLLVIYIRKGKLGYAFRAIRDDEEGAKSTGIAVTHYKVLAFVLSGVMVAVAGGLYGGFIAYIDAPTMFDGQITVTMLVMAILGGSDSILGPVVGAVFLKFVMDYLWNSFQNLHSLFLGVVIILIVLFLPRGIIPFLEEQWRRRRIPMSGQAKSEV